jgi:hypothetical protein
LNLKLFLITALVALFLAVGASYAVVVSQNSSSHVVGPAANYGPAERPSP